LLALVAVSIFKLLSWLKNCLIKSEADDDHFHAQHQIEDLTEETDHSEGVNDSNQK